jgi:CubicO group peptidase (beta-lactamase class C family)
MPRGPSAPTSRVILLALVLISLVLRPAGADAPNGTRGVLPRSAPEAQGISSAALLDFVRAADRDLDAMHSVMVLRHGHVVAEGWWTPYATDLRHTMFSLTKSFTSTAIGIAVHEGRLTVDDPVTKFFPDQVPAEPGDLLAALRVRDLLSMSTGHHTEPALRETSEWTKAFLAAKIEHKPGTFFLYNTPASYMLSAILQKVTGEKTVDYLRPRLFEPLGIEDLVWETSPEGVTIGGYGLHLRTEELARFGQLYLQKGKWQGRQLVPEAWIGAATSRQVSNGSNPASDWDQGYGYQFWRTRHNTYRGDGAFGQFCLVMPEQDAVIVITSGVKSMQAVLDLVFEKLLPAFGTTPLPANAAGHRALQEALAGLTLHPQPGGVAAGPAVRWGRTFRFEDNPVRIEAVTLDRGAGGIPQLTTRMAGADERFLVPAGRWATHRLASPAPMFGQLVATSGAWVDPSTLLVTFAFYETPFKQQVRLSFTDEGLAFDLEQHVSFGPTRLPRLMARDTD